jgi:PQQ-dependent catabolism-associated beta-propeller protein
MAVSPDDKTVVCTSETTSMAHFIDVATHNVVASVLVGTRPRFAVFTKDGSQVWVSSEVAGTVAVIDAASHKVLKTIRFNLPEVPTAAIQAVGINLTADGKYAFVDLGPANRVAVIDPKTFEVEKYLLVGQRVWHNAFSPDQKLLYTANGLSNDMSVIDVSALDVTQSVPVGQSPWGVVVGP